MRLNSLVFIASLNSKDRTTLVQTFKNQRPDLTNLLLAFNTSDPMSYIVQKEDITFTRSELKRELDTDDDSSSSPDIDIPPFLRRREF